ncbi:MAG: hypothetical protein ACRDRP_06400 [Pseudonocardiaceae bacterium]
MASYTGRSITHCNTDVEQTVAGLGNSMQCPDRRSRPLATR